MIALTLVIGCGLAAWEWLAWREVRAARRALAGGRYQEAGDAVGRLLKLRLRRAEAQYLQAKTAIALGRRGEYASSLKQSAALGYPNDRLDVLRALMDAQFGRLAQAQPVLAQAFAQAEPGTPDLMVDEALARVYLERAKIDLGRNQARAALAHVDRVVVLTPFDPAVHYQRWTARHPAYVKLGTDSTSASKTLTSLQFGLLSLMNW